MTLQAWLSIGLSVVALITTIINYVLVVAKMKWEQEQFKAEKTRLWQRVEEHERAINTLHKNEEKMPEYVTRKFEKLDGQINALQQQVHEVQIETKGMSGQLNVLVSLFNNQKLRAPSPI